MQDLCHAGLYIRMSSNPTGGFLINLFPHSLFGDAFFHVLFYDFLRIVCFDFCVFFCCIVLYF